MMSPRSIAVPFALSLCCLVSFLPSAFALRIAVVNLTTEQKVVRAEAVVIGKVVDIEKDTVEAVPFANAPNKVTYQIGLIRIEDSLQGVKDLTQIRVGWQFGANNPADPQVEGKIRLPNRGLAAQNIALEQGQEGCFFLQKHPTANFYIVLPNARPLIKKADNYDKELTKVKAIRKILDKPIDALKSEKADERKLAASVLVQNHAQYPAVVDPKKGPKQEPIDEEQSRLILKAISEMGWENPTDPMVSLSGLLGYLNLTPQDGWKQPVFNGQGDFGKVMKEGFDTWYKQNGEKFRVKRWVAEK
jgi:hypothetical protein